MNINLTKTGVTIKLKYKTIIFLGTLIVGYFGLTLPDIINKIITMF